MRLRFSLPRWSACLLLLAAVWLSAAGAPAQVRIPNEAMADVAELERVIRVGNELERAQRWGEALSHYEQALRIHPGMRDLEQKLLEARLHYEVGRRYVESSYLKSLSQMSERDALELYGEVLSNIHSHYVDPPDWTVLTRRGVAALQVALTEPAFAQRYRLSLSEQQAASVVGPIHRLLDSRAANSRYDARDFAAVAARFAQQELGVPPPATILEFASAAGASLDEYSAFLTSGQLDEVLAQIEGNFVGLGLELKAEQQSLLIVSVIPLGPADGSQIRPGDRIVAVDGQSMSRISTDVAADMLKGVEGSQVEVQILTAQGQQRTLRLQRRRVEVPSVEDVSLVDPQAGTGYLRLTSFQKTTGRDVDASLWKLHRQGMRTLIIDVRGNPGGLLTAAIDVADKFVSDGSIVATRGRSPGENNDYQAHLMGTWRVPLIVLIDGDSASASEIFAGAIRDHQRGTVMGTRSYGKGSVQGIFPLGVAHAGLRLTTAKFYSPSGQPISRQGVQPDILVHSVAKTSETAAASPQDGEDTVLQAAIHYARQKLRSP